MIAASLFRNYDIRGEYGKELTPEAGYTIARAFSVYAHPKNVVVGADCRVSSPALKAQVVQGLLDSGINVIDIGEVSTDVLYFASWYYKFDSGIMITASHMPKQFNGLKFLRLNEAGMLAPIGKGLGMEELQAIAEKGDWPTVATPGTMSTKDVWNDFVAFTQSFVDVKKIKPLTVVMDTGNGMGGPSATKVYGNLPITMIPMYFDPDGNFPNHPANPLEPENRRDIIAKVKEVKPDFGVAWDADCDRAYFIDENGTYVDGDFITALQAIYFLKKNPGSGIVYDLRSTLAVKNWVEKLGGVAYMERVGHTFIKHRMAETKAVFGGEVSGHYYFAKNAYMENGFAPPLIIMEMMSETGKKLSQLVRELGDYYVSGEHNFKVADIKQTMGKIEMVFGPSAKEVLRMDGLSFEYENWRFNVRPSANDPVLRLCLEASSPELVQEKLAEVQKVITG